MKKVLIWFAIAAVVAAIIFMVFREYSRGLTPRCLNAGSSLRIKRELYDLCYNRETKQPAWILQFYGGSTSKAVHTEPLSRYKADPRVALEDQASAQDYESSRWAVGNYIFPISELVSEVTDENEQDQFLFSVVSPQNPGFYSGYWMKLREYARSRASRAASPAYIGILSGPLFKSV